MRYLWIFFKNLSSSPEKKVLIENFLSLSFLRIANNIIPLIAFPYLVRVLGPAKFGLISFAQAFIQYFIYFTDYGFALSASRDISINRDDRNKVSDIFNSVMFIKFLFLAISFIVLSLLVISVPMFKDYLILYLFTFGIVLGDVLFPSWFFQGMEKMKHIALLNVISKTLFTISIFIFIKREDHYVYVPLLNAMGGLVAGLLALRIVTKEFNVRFRFPGFRSILHQLKEGRHIFFSIVSINLYLTTNTFVLGLFTNYTIVGYYSAAEKIVRFLTQLLNPIFQAVYPYLSKVVADSSDAAIRMLKKLLLFTVAASFSVFCIFNIFLNQVIGLLLGQDFLPSGAVARILSPLLIIIPVAYILANLAMLPFKMDRYFFRIYASGAVINIFLLLILLYVFQLGGKGAAFANLITETILTISMYLVLRKHAPKIVF